MDLTKAITNIRPSIVQIVFSASNVSPELSKELVSINQGVAGSRPARLIR